MFHKVVSYILSQSGFLFVVGSLMALSSAWGVTFSKNLNAKERAQVIEVLGFGGTPKGLTSPLPLGSQLGIEMGLGYDFVNTSDLNHLGNHKGQGDEVSIPVLSFGKGLYYDIDFFLQFSPLPSDEKISHYSGILRWAFYDFKNSPMKASMSFSAGVNTYADLLSLKTSAFDILISYYLDNLSLYFGVGYVRAVGFFYGGSDSMADDLETHLHEDAQSRGVVGLDYDLNPYFLSFEMDYFTDAVFAFKVGIRI